MLGFLGGLIISLISGKKIQEEMENFRFWVIISLFGYSENKGNVNEMIKFDSLPYVGG